MSNNYSEGQTVSFGANDFNEGPARQMLVTVVSSRFVKLEYPPDIKSQPKIAIRWVLKTTKGKEFNKEYSTGLNWDEKASVSPDGKSLVAKKEYSGLSKLCNAFYLRERAIKAAFPEEIIKNDIAVFDGATFTMEEGKNPRVKGAGTTWYPLQYHPEGMQAVMTARGWTTSPDGVTGVPTNPSTFVPAPSAPTISPEVMETAKSALLTIVAAKGGSVKRTELPNALGPIAAANGWDKEMRPAVTFALWDVAQLKEVVAAASLKIDAGGDTISS